MRAPFSGRRSHSPSLSRALTDRTGDHGERGIDGPWTNRKDVVLASAGTDLGPDVGPVSYTPLTLPTKA